MHFQLRDGPTILTRNALPFVVDHFILVGTPTASSTATHIIMGLLQPQLQVLPLDGTVSDFR